MTHKTGVDIILEELPHPTLCIAPRWWDDAVPVIRTKADAEMLMASLKEFLEVWEDES